MARMAVLVDLGFFLKRYNRAKQERAGSAATAKNVARAVWNAAIAHARRNGDEIYRIFVYDCRPLNKRIHNPLTRRAIDLSRTSEYCFRSKLHVELICLRKVALRWGELADRSRWVIRAEPMRQLLNGSLRLDQLQERDVIYDVGQKGVDVKIGVDIASIAYKQLADRIVLISGDADFVPASRLAGHDRSRAGSRANQPGRQGG